MVEKPHRSGEGVSYQPPVKPPTSAGESRRAGRAHGPTGQDGPAALLSINWRGCQSPEVGTSDRDSGTPSGANACGRRVPSGRGQQAVSLSVRPSPSECASLRAGVPAEPSSGVPSQPVPITARPVTVLEGAKLRHLHGPLLFFDALAQLSISNLLRSTVALRCPMMLRPSELAHDARTRAIADARSSTDWLCGTCDSTQFHTRCGVLSSGHTLR